MLGHETGNRGCRLGPTLAIRVYKFGGTSVRDAIRVMGVVQLIAQARQPLIIVTSAPAGITDLLQGITDHATAQSAVTNLADRFLALVSEVVAPSHQRQLSALVGRQLEKVRAPESDADRAKHMSLGESLMAPILAASLQHRGIRAVALDARELICTDGAYLGGRVVFDVTTKRIQAAVERALAHHGVMVVGGFIAGNAAGETTTLGRNGSDYTASIVGAAVEADEVWIWTDVDGIYTADPRHHAAATLIPEISFRESAEAAYFGAKVVHPFTMWPLLDSQTSLRIKNTLRPDQPGTLICHEPERRGSQLIVSTVDPVVVVTVGGYGLVGVPGVAAKVFGSIAAAGVNVLMISQSSSEHNISFVVHERESESAVSAVNMDLAGWISDEHRVDRISVIKDAAIVTVVGEDMRGRVGIAGQIFSALGEVGVNVMVIAQGSSEYSISIVVKSADVRLATDAILNAKGTGS